MKKSSWPIRKGAHRAPMAPSKRNIFGAGPHGFCVRLIFSLFALLASVQTASAGTVLIDAAGRKVELSAPAKRILLDAPAYYPALSLLSKNAADLIVGISNAPSGRDSGPVSEMLREVSDKPRLGSIWARTFSVEKALELKPDLLIAALSLRGKATAIEDAFAKVGIAIIYVDFAENPAGNTAQSIEIIGRAIGAEQKAAEFVDLYHRHIQRITDRLKTPGLARPKLLAMYDGRGAACCLASPSSGVIAYFGGLGISNIADGAGPSRSTQTAQLSPEYVIERDPDIFVAIVTGRGQDSLLGQPPPIPQGLASLEALKRQPGLRDISAMRNGRIHAIDLSLTISPLNFLAFEALAKWLHPDLYADIDPQATLDEINARFLKTPLTGPFWVSLDPAADKASGKGP